MRQKLRKLPREQPDTSAAERMWQEMVAYYDGVELLDAGDPQRVEIQGEMHALAGPPPDPLLRPVDVAFLVINEKVDTLAKRFFQPGPLSGRRHEEEALERAAILLTIGLNPEVLAAAGLRAKDERLRGTLTEIEAILYFYRMWVVKARILAIERLRQRLPAEHPWISGLLRGAVPAPDRATRIAQVCLRGSRVRFESAEDNLRAIEAALKMHDAYRPDGIKNGDELLGKNRRVSAAGLALTLEGAAGPKGLLWFKPGAEIGVGPTQATDVLNQEFGRWHKEKAEPLSLSLDAPEGGGESERTLGDEEGRGDASSTPASVETALARAAAADFGLGSLFREILDSIDAVADSNPDAALTMASGIVRLVDLLRTEPKPSVRAGILYAWGRGDSYRGGLDPRHISKAIGVGVKTVRRWEKEGLARLVAAGLRDRAESSPG